MRRSFLLVLPFSFCSASITPTRRQSTLQPGNRAASVSTSTSMGSPSAARVLGTKPKSYGNIIPSGMILESLKDLDDESNLILLRYPLGVSITTVIGFFDSRIDRVFFI